MLATATFLLSITGLMGLFALRAYEDKHNTRLFADARDTLDDLTLKGESQLKHLESWGRYSLTLPRTWVTSGFASIASGARHIERSATAVVRNTSNDAGVDAPSSALLKSVIARKAELRASLNEVETKS